MGEQVWPPNRQREAKRQDEERRLGDGRAEYEERIQAGGQAAALHLAVAEHGGIAALERQVGMALVDRSGRTARLTTAGRRLAGHARHVLASLEAAETDLASLGGDLRGTLAVGTIATLGRTLLPAALTTLRSRSCPPSPRPTRWGTPPASGSSAPTGRACTVRSMPPSARAPASTR